MQHRELGPNYKRVVTWDTVPIDRDDWQSDQLHTIRGHVAGDVILCSIPPSGKCKVINVYWDPQLERAVFEYDDEPEP